MRDAGSEHRVVLQVCFLFLYNFIFLIVFASFFTGTLKMHFRQDFSTDLTIFELNAVAIFI